MVAFGALYTVLRAWAMPEDPAVAVENALAVVTLELKFDLFFERALQSVILDQAWLVPALNVYYVAMHLPPIVGLLVFTYVRRPAAWPFVRDVFIAFTTLGLIVHILYPVAPPWFVEGLGIGDTFDKAHQTATASSTVGNPFAAMPSMHFGWALAAGVGFALLARPHWVRALGGLHPAVMGFAIVATGNHYILDAVASALLLAIAVGGVALVRDVSPIKALRAGRSRPGEPPPSSRRPAGRR